MERTAENIKLTTRKLTCIYNKERLPFGCSLFFVIGQGLKTNAYLLAPVLNGDYSQNGQAGRLNACAGSALRATAYGVGK